MIFKLIDMALTILAAPFQKSEEHEKEEKQPEMRQSWDGKLYDANQEHISLRDHKCDPE